MIRRAGSPDHVGNLNPIRAFPPMKKKERQIVRPSKLTVTHEACIEVRFSCLDFIGVHRKMTRNTDIRTLKNMYTHTHTPTHTHTCNGGSGMCGFSECPCKNIM